MTIFWLIIYLLVSYGVVECLDMVLINVDGESLDIKDKILILCIWLPVVVLVSIICLVVKLEDLHDRYMAKKQ